MTDPVNFDVLWEATDDQAPGGGMGYSFRAALDKIKVPVYLNNDPDNNPIPIKYEVKWMVFVATSFVDIAENPGGINVFAFDLETGTKQWTFSSTYADSVNDIPGAVTTHDIDNDTLADRLYVGDMNGRMWEIALTDDPADKLYKSDKFGKVRGSIYISRKHAYMTTFEGEIIQIGDEDFASGTGNRVVLKSWQDR